MYSINFYGEMGDLTGLQTSEVLIHFFQVIIIKKNFFWSTPLQWKDRSLISGPPGNYLIIILSLYLSLLCSQALDSWTVVMMGTCSLSDSKEMLPPFTKIFFKSQKDAEFYQKNPPYPPNIWEITINLDVMYHIDGYSFFIHIFWFLF